MPSNFPLPGIVIKYIFLPIVMVKWMVTSVSEDILPQSLLCLEYGYGSFYETSVPSLQYDTS
jgi:hypothetical protein